jgi:uncharacterized protein YdiU (UPF0061 family)
MSLTNIHTATALLSRADTSGIFSDQATIYPFNKPVLIVTGPFSQDDVNQYDWALRNPHIGSWIRQHAMSTLAATVGAITVADDKLDIPQVRVGPGLSEALMPSDETRYVVIIQGRSGANRVKVMVTDTREKAAVMMMQEALNGYSTAFSTSYIGPLLKDVSVNAKFERTHELLHPIMVEGQAITVHLVCCESPAHYDKAPVLYYS